MARTLPKWPTYHPSSCTTWVMTGNSDALRKTAQLVQGSAAWNAISAGKRPVIHAARDGEHTGLAEYPLVKTTPSAAKASMFGVRTRVDAVLPYTLTSPKPLCTHTCALCLFGSALQSR
jgi:hypothetical protein